MLELRLKLLRVDLSKTCLDQPLTNLLYMRPKYVPHHTGFGYIVFGHDQTLARFMILPSESTVLDTIPFFFLLGGVIAMDTKPQTYHFSRTIANFASDKGVGVSSLRDNKISEDLGRDIRKKFQWTKRNKVKSLQALDQPVSHVILHLTLCLHLSYFTQPYNYRSDNEGG